MFLSLAAADDSRFESRSASQTTNQHSSHRASLRSSCEALPDENISYKQTNYHYYHIHISCKHRRCKIKHWKLTIRKLKISSCQKIKFFKISNYRFTFCNSWVPWPGPRHLQEAGQKGAGRQVHPLPPPSPPLLGYASPPLPAVIGGRQN